MAALHNDGTVQYGSRILNLYTGTVSAAYVADNININRPAKVIQRTNELGEPSGSVGVADFVTGSATLQLANDSAAEPAGGVTFTDTFAASQETFILTTVGRAESKDGEKKVSVEFVKKYN